MQPAVRAFYTAHSRFSDPGPFAGPLAGLPADLTALQAAIDGLLIHVWKVRRDTPQRLQPGAHAVATRHVRRLLDHLLALDAQPLTVARPPERRVIGDCRHFALLLTTILRERGIPARARCGFATYLEETHYQDHWVCEYWDDRRQRWVMEDADLQRHDVPADEFITGGRACQRCRHDAAGNQFGFDPDLRGQWVTRVNLVRDFAALNGFESVSGDAWGLALTDEAALTAGDLAVLDRAARLSPSDDALAERQALYAASDGLRAPAVIQHYDYITTFDWRPVAWQDEA